MIALLALMTWAAQATFVPDSTSLVSESCPNGYFDPGETNTVTFVIKNDTDNDLSDVQVELLADGSVYGTNTVTGSNVEWVATDKTGKVNVPKKTTLPVTFTFRTQGTCGRGNVVNPQLLVTWKESANPELVTFSGDKLAHSGQLGATTPQSYSFNNTNPITINDFANADNAGKASPYPSTVTVSSVPNDAASPAATGERVVDVSVTLKNVTHPTQTEVAALLVGPRGQKVVLFRGAGNTVGGFNNSTFTINGTAGTAVPLVAPINNGATYSAADYGVGNFFGSAPAAPYGSMSDFDNLDPNGAWSLYLIDTTGTQGAVGGTVAGGWTLTIATEKVVCCAGGQNAPSISQNRDSRIRPGIADVTISEDTIFSGDEIKDSQVHSPTIHFTVHDVDQATADSVQVTAVSADQSIIKNGNIKIGGSGGDRTLEFKTEPNANGNVAITVTAQDLQGNAGTATFTLKVTPVNDCPVVSDIRNQASNKGTGTPPLPFTVSDVETAPDFLVLTAHAFDPVTHQASTEVPDSNIFFTGTGNDRTVTVLPATANTQGSARIEINVQDTNGCTTTNAFTVDFSTPVGYPTVSPFDNIVTDEDKPVTVGFTVRSGSSTPVDNLQIAAVSFNANLIPTSAIVLGGSGTERTLTLTPIANHNSTNSGNASISVSVTDGALVSTRTFVFIVKPVNDKPSVSPISNQVVGESSATGPIAFTVGDVETAANQLTITYVSSNPGLVPNTVNGVPASDGVSTPGVFIGNGANPQDRVVRVVPSPHAFGTTTIQLSVHDTGLEGQAPETTTSSFVLQVTPVNDPPTILQAGSALLNNLDGTPADPIPTALTINEDVGVPTTGDIDLAHTAFQTVHLTGIYPGLAPNFPQNESEQTVTLSATVDHPEIVAEVGFDTEHDAQKVKLPGTSTDLRFKLVHNAYGVVTVTLTATDNGTGALGNDNQTTVRQFKINVAPLNDLPTMDTIGNQTVPQGSAIIIPIVLKDVETAPGNMTLTATSSAPGIVNPNNIIFGGGNTFVTIKAENALGTAHITITACDRGPTDSGANPACAQSVQFDVVSANIPINNPPNIDSLTPTATTIVEDGVAVASLTVSDPDVGDVTDPKFKLVGTSSNEAIVPSANILFGGAGNSRTMAVAPAKDANGSVIITITAIDPHGFGSAPKQFTLTIIPVEDQPTISVTQSTDSGTKWSGGTISALEDTSPVPDPKTGSGLIEVKVHDAETPADQLKVTAVSSNQSLIPDANIKVSSTGETRTLTIAPVANRSGTATITVTVEDGAGNKVPTTFNVQIVPVNDAPTANSVSNLSIPENAGVQTVIIGGITAGPEEGGQTLTLSATATDKGSDPAVNNLIQNLSVTPGQIVTPANNAAQIATLTFQPTAQKFGTATIKLTIQDNGGTSNGGADKKELSFDVVIGEFNTPPTITVPNQFQTVTIPPGTASPVIPINVNDASNETAPTSLILTFTSDNPQLVPNTPANLQQTGTGTSRGLIITPLANVFGTANVTATVTDTGRKDGSDVKSTSTVIKVNVSAGQNPIISPIADVVTHVNQDTDIIPFTVNDAQTPAAQLTVSASSDNQTVAPNFNIQIGGSGSSRAIIIRPAQDRSGTANITVTVTDANGNTANSKFKLTVLGNPPTITTVANQLIQKGATTGALSFQVGDKETFPGFLVVTAKSSNQTLVPDSNIFLGGSNTDRTVNVAGAAGQSGTTTITLTVTDGEGQTATSTFTVSTPPATENTKPTISSISDINAVVNQSLPLIPFTVGDKETAPTDLKVTATADNAGLVPASGIFLGGTGTSRTMLITPTRDKTGTSTVIVTVTDGDGASTSTSFKVTIGSKSVASDFNGDGVPDIIYQDANGYLAAWFMSGDDLLSAANLSPNNPGTGWRVVDTGDFNGDGKPDLLFQYTDGSLAVWNMSGVNLSSSAFLNPSNVSSPGWKAVAVADFNGDGKPDILFQNDDGTLAVWNMNGLNMTSVTILQPANAGSGWKAVGAGDFNRDGTMDILLQHTDGTMGVWYLRNGTLLLAALLQPSFPGTDWRAVGTVDLNGDGKIDILFQNRASNDVAIWYMDGAKLILGKVLNPSNPGGTWQIVAP